MVSITSIVSAVIVAFAAVTTTSADALLRVGDYYRPSGVLVSGVPGNTKPYRRSPCPGLNALANHGHIPRNGQNINPTELGNALQSVYNLADDAVAVLLTQIPTSNFSLDVLSTHNVIEHDASLAHKDAYYGKDPATVDNDLACDLLDRAVDGVLGVTQLGATRKDRLAACVANNPNCTFGTTQATLGYTESSIFILGFGAKNNETVSVNTARSFLVNEKIPSSYIKASTPITLAEVRTTAAKVIAASQ